jgi:hypothetical protein
VTPEDPWGSPDLTPQVLSRSCKFGFVTGKITCLLRTCRRWIPRTGEGQTSGSPQGSGARVSRSRLGARFRRRPHGYGSSTHRSKGEP